jgi:guanylate kinase
LEGALSRRGLCLVLAAPSGAGKSSITRALLRADAALALSVSVTTRPPRSGEQEGVHYFFRDTAQFEALIEQDGLLEWARVFGHSYGTPRAPVEQAMADGRDMVFDIDWQGHRRLRAALPGDVVGVFVLPPSMAELERRLRARGDTDAEIRRRMAAAREEIEHCREFDYVVVNAELDTATRQVAAVLEAARLATARQVWLDSKARGSAP